MTDELDNGITGLSLLLTVFEEGAKRLTSWKGMIRSNTAIRGTTERSDEMERVLLGFTLQQVLEEGAKRLTTLLWYCWVITTYGITSGWTL